MLPDDQTCFRALSARDARFDGLFFVAVSTTGIYCRPVCPARTPRKDRCTFFSYPAAAEHHGYRPCLRCRPELAPGHAPIDATRHIAQAAARRIEAGALNHEGTVDDLADEFGITARQLRRVVQSEFGVTPVELAQTRRLLLAKQLLAETSLSMIDVAHSSGFDSVRRFNVLFKKRYSLTPSKMRRASERCHDNGSISLSVGYRAPYAWQELLQFLRPRLTSGVEAIIDDTYVRSLRINDCQGWIHVSHPPDAGVLTLQVSVDLLPVLSPLLVRVRRLFDTDARPDAITSHLRHDTRLASSIRHHPGLRVPGAVDELELITRAILGQQVTVKSASTLAGRLAARLGEPIATPFAEITRLSPTPERLARARTTTLTNLGILPARAQTIQSVARDVVNQSLALTTDDFDSAVEQLKDYRGIGDWTAQYVTMRALPWPDAFPDGDLVLRQVTGDTTSAKLRQMAESWRPWRAYAAMHLWQSATDASNKN